MSDSLNELKAELESKWREHCKASQEKQISDNTAKFGENRLLWPHKSGRVDSNVPAVIVPSIRVTPEQWEQCRQQGYIDWTSLQASAMADAGFYKLLLRCQICFLDGVERIVLKRMPDGTFIQNNSFEKQS